MSDLLHPAAKFKIDSKEFEKEMDKVFADKAVQCNLLVPPREGWFTRLLSKIGFGFKWIWHVIRFRKSLDLSNLPVEASSEKNKEMSITVYSVPPPPPPMPAKMSVGYLRMTQVPNTENTKVLANRDTMLNEIKTFKGLKSTGQSNIHPRKILVPKSSFVRLLEKRRLKIKHGTDISMMEDTNEENLDWRE